MAKKKATRSPYSKRQEDKLIDGIVDALDRFRQGATWLTACETMIKVDWIVSQFRRALVERLIAEDHDYILSHVKIDPAELDQERAEDEAARLAEEMSEDELDKLLKEYD